MGSLGCPGDCGGGLAGSHRADDTEAGGKDGVREGMEWWSEGNMIRRITVAFGFGNSWGDALDTDEREYY